MNRKLKSTTSAIIRLCAGAMVLIFLLIPFIEAFHVHPKVSATIAVPANGIVKKQQHHCNICDYLIKIHSHQLHDWDVMSFKPVQAPVFVQVFNLRFPTATGFKYSCTNKGPPTAC